MIRKAVQERRAMGVPDDDTAAISVLSESLDHYIKDLTSIAEQAGIQVQPRAKEVDYQYTFQPTVKDEKGETQVPGWLQIDTIGEKGENVRSTSLAQLKREGVNLPDIPRDLPAGKYKVPDVQRALSSRSFKESQPGPFVSDLPRRLIGLVKKPRGGITPGPTGDIPARNLPNVLKRLGASDAEIRIYLDAGLKDLLKDNVANLPQIAQWMEDNAPRVEVKELYEDNQADPRSVRHAWLVHNLYDTLSQDQKYALNDVVSGRLQLQDLLDFTKEKGLAPFEGERLATLNEYITLTRDIRENAPPRRLEGGRASYASIAPKPEIEMKGYVEGLIRLPIQKAYEGWMVYARNSGTALQGFHTKQEAMDWVAQGDYPQEFEIREHPRAVPADPLFEGPHFHANDKNVLAFFRGYVEGDTFHVIEVQSDWAQRVREQKETRTRMEKRFEVRFDDSIKRWGVWDHQGRGAWIATGMTEAHARANRDAQVEEHVRASSGKSREHPLLKDHETIAVKAAINYAQKLGLKKIAISDAETAMMTEQHDLAAAQSYSATSSNFTTYDTKEEAEDAAKEWKRHGGPQDLPVHQWKLSIKKDPETDQWYFEFENPKGLEVPQEKGMRLHYDEVLPNIAKKLTGDKGEKVDYGWHKSAFVAAKEDDPDYQQIMRGSPVFGTRKDPKANITARVYRLDKVDKGAKLLFDGPVINDKTGFAEESLGEFNPREFPEFDQELPIEPEFKHRPVIENVVPPLRSEVRWVSDKKKLMKWVKVATRSEESKETTTKFIAVRDKKSDRVFVWPVWRSTDNRVRVNNSIKPKIDSEIGLARALGWPDSQLARLRTTTARDRAADLPTGDMDNFQQLFKEVSSGAQADRWLDELIEDEKYAPLGFLYAAEQAKGRHFVFDSEEKFRAEASLQEETIVDKGGFLDVGEGRAVLDKLIELSPEDANALQLLSAMIEATPDAKRLDGKPDSLGKLRANVSRLIAGFLISPHGKKIAEFLQEVKTPGELFRVRYGGRYFGLFTPEQWDQWKAILRKQDDKDKKGASQKDLRELIEKGLDEAQVPFSTFLATTVPWEGPRAMGEALYEEKQSFGDKEGEGTDLLDEDSGEAGAEAHPELTATADLNIPDAAMAIVGLTNLEQDAIGRAFRNVGTEDDPRYRRTEIKAILEARVDSADNGFTSAADDYEFQAIKEELSAVVGDILLATRDARLKLNDDFLYGIYANLDKISRDSQPELTGFRETNDSIQRTFMNVVGWLAGRGVDVRLVQQSVNSEIEHLRKEWGRSISHEDGRRMILLTMHDVAQPTRENLRVLLHETVHQLFADEAPYVQRLIHEAIQRLTDLQMSVFSKTYDDRVKSQRLPARLLMEEVLAEHLSFTGIEQTQARSLVQRFIAGLQQLLSRAILAFSKLRLVQLSPEWTLRYMENRFREVLDRALNPHTNFEELTGIGEKVARYRAMLFNPVGYVVEHYDIASGQFVINDVADESVLASEFNLENKLAFTDIVVRDNDGEVTGWVNLTAPSRDSSETVKKQAKKEQALYNEVAALAKKLVYLKTGTEDEQEAEELTSAILWRQKGSKRDVEHEQLNAAMGGTPLTDIWKKIYIKYREMGQFGQLYSLVDDLAAAGEHAQFEILNDVIKQVEGLVSADDIVNPLNPSEVLLKRGEPFTSERLNKILVTGIERIKTMPDTSRDSQPTYRVPVTQQESDERVQKSFEYEFAALNEQADFYHRLFDPIVAPTKMEFGKYLKKVLGIHNPEASLESLSKAADAKNLQINRKLRLNDSAGVQNAVQSPIDRDNIAKRLVETATRALNNLRSKAIEIAAGIEKSEKEVQAAKDRFVRFETKLHDIVAIRDNALKVLRKGLRSVESSAKRLSTWSARHDGLTGIAAELFNLSEDEFLDDDRVELVEDAFNEHTEDLFITDVITAALQNGIDFDALSPKQIRKRIEEAARATKDERLVQVADGSPQG